MEDKFVVSSSPHLLTQESTDTIMRDVVIALIPPTIAGVIFFGWWGLAIVIIGMLSAMVTESVLLRKSLSFNSLKGDWSAAVTGILVALILPPYSPWWVVAIGSFIAIAIGKLFFGGIGNNTFNPALVGRAILFVSWPVFMTAWSKPVGTHDVMTAATPLGGADATYTELFMGNVSGCLGETSVLAILIGGIFLIARGHVDWVVPVSYLASMAALAPIAGEDPVFHLLSGGAVFAAFFMATCMVTSPFTRSGKVIFGLGCGILTGLMRYYGAAPEGVTYAILIMNALVPFINSYTRPRIYGEVSER